MIWKDEKVEVLEHETEAFSITIRCRLIGGLDDWILSVCVWTGFEWGSG